MQSFVRRGFTLIELLVVIAIIAILSVVVILTLNPSELLRQSRDANRVSDMDTINHALGLYSVDQGSNSNFNMGLPSTTYVSIPDPAATSTAGDQCQGLGLPSLSSGYSYHCAASSTFRKTDGTGWIPVNLQTISSGSPLAHLPVDPVNQTSSNYYYTYITDGTRYAIATGLESLKYQKQYLSSSSTDSTHYIAGSNPTLVTQLSQQVSGLIAFYTMEEGSGSSIIDSSGNSNTGTWFGTPAGTSGYYSAGEVGTYAGYFNGTNDYITASIPEVATTTGPANTVSFWMNYSGYGSSGVVVLNLGSFNYHIQSSLCGGINSAGYVLGVVPPATSTWIYVTLIMYNGTYGSNGSTLYYNGAATSPTCMSGGATAAANSTFIIGRYSSGGYYFPGLLDNIRVYNRALSPAEISTLYNAEKPNMNNI